MCELRCGEYRQRRAPTNLIRTYYSHSYLAIVCMTVEERSKEEVCPRTHTHTHTHTHTLAHEYVLRVKEAMKRIEEEGGAEARPIGSTLDEFICVEDPQRWSGSGKRSKGIEYDRRYTGCWSPLSP